MYCRPNGRPRRLTAQFQMAESCTLFLLDKSWKCRMISLSLLNCLCITYRKSEKEDTTFPAEFLCLFFNFPGQFSLSALDASRCLTGYTNAMYCLRLHCTPYCTAHYIVLHTILRCTLYCTAHYIAFHTLLRSTLIFTAHFLALHTILH